MYAQNLVGRRIGQHFYHAGGVAQSPRAAIGQKWEGTCLVSPARSFELLFGLTHPCDLRIGVNHPRNGVEVDMPMLASNALSHGNALFLGLVRQHRAAHHIANRPDVGQVGFAVSVGHNRAALVQLQSDSFRGKPNRVGNAANRDDELVYVQRLGFAFGIGVRHRHTFFTGFNVANLDAQLNLQALLGESLVRLLGNLLVHSAEESWQTFQHRHLGPQTPPDRAHFQANHT